MTAKEEAEIDKIEAEADQVRIDSGVLHPEEARKAVAAKPGSRYSDINVETCQNRRGRPGEPRRPAVQAEDRRRRRQRDRRLRR
jgi:hypothetical protein